MPSEYTVKQWKPWENEDGIVRDVHGNYKGSVIFDEDSSEPIDATFKTQPNPGDKKFGTVSEYTTKAGKVRVGFKSAPKPLDGQQTFVKPEKKEWVDHSDAIRAQWAIGQSVQLSIANGKLDLAAVEADAKKIYAMVDRVQNSDAKMEKPLSTEELQARAETKRDAEQLRNTLKSDEVYDFSEEPINLDDIPF